MTFDGLTEDGLDAPRAKDFYDIIREGTLDRVDGDIEFDAHTTFGPLAAEQAIQLGSLSQAVLELYNSRILNNARGLLLSDLLQIVDVKRKPAKASRIEVQRLDGDYNTGIPSGKRVQGGGQDGNLQWSTLEDRVLGIEVSIDSVAGSAGDWEYDVNAPANTSAVRVTYAAASSDGIQEVTDGVTEAFNTNTQINSVLEARKLDTDGDGIDDSVIITPLKGQDIDVALVGNPGGAHSTNKGRNYAIVEAIEVGPLFAETGAVDTISTSVDGWDSTTSLTDAVPGRFRESDEEAFLRSREETQKPGSSAVASVEGAISEFEFIDSVQAIENDTKLDTTINNLTIPAGDMAVVLWPDTLTSDEADQVIEQIYINTPIGTGVAEDSTPFTTVSRTVVTDTDQEKDVAFHYANDITVDVKIEVTLESGFGIGEVIGNIQDGVEDYAETLLVGDDFRRLPVFGAIDDTNGVDQVDLLELQKSGGGYSASDVSIADVEIAILGSQDITET